MKDRILITILFWKDDQAQAMELAKLLADLQPEHCDSADILFVSRFDCKHDVKAEQYVARKFNIYSYTSTRRGVGWPMGCNSIFFGAMEWIYHKIAGGKIPHYKAILLLGADSAPLRKDWLAQLHGKWADASRAGVRVGGALLPGERDHINGDCIVLSGELKFLKWLALDVQDIPNRAGWDWLLGEQFKRWGWMDFSFIKSWWRKPSMSQDEWEKAVRSGISWIHGVKNNDLINLTRKNLL